MKKLAVELFIVVVGVLIALGVDGWRQDREEFQIAEAHLVDITAELRRNLCTVERVKATVLAAKFRGLQATLDFLNHPKSDVADPKGLLHAFVLSAETVQPWLVDNQYQALQNSGDVRFLRKLAPGSSISDVYRSHEVLFSQDERILGTYPEVVNALVPAQLQSRFNPLSWYALGVEAPSIVDDPDLEKAVEAIRERRVELLALARNEVAVATGRWYALTRIAQDHRDIIKTLARWDRAAVPLEQYLGECRTISAFPETPPVKP